MKLPVVSGTEAVRAFGRIGYESDTKWTSRKAATSSSATCSPRTGGYPYPITKSWQRAHFER
jgi:hypothetical protein